MSKKGIWEVEGNRGMLLEDHSESLLVKRKAPRQYHLCRKRKCQYGIHLFLWHMLKSFNFADIRLKKKTKKVFYKCSKHFGGYLACWHQKDSNSLAVVLSCYCQTVWIHLACGRNGHNTCGQKWMTF